jgi:hypothetical protein
MTESSSGGLAPEIAAAWRRLRDCGCADVYYCPTSREIECPRHSGFTTCCDRTEEHLLVR